MTDWYFEDFTVGRVVETAPWPVNADEIVSYARKYDPQRFHTDPEEAEKTAFGGLVASGFHTLAIASAQLVRSGIFAAAGKGGPGMNDVRWRKPVRPGDVIRTLATVREARVSGSKPDRGFVTFDLESSTDAGIVLTVSITVILGLREPA